MQRKLISAAVIALALFGEVGRAQTSQDSAFAKSALSAGQIADAISAGVSAREPLVVVAGSAGGGFQGRALRGIGAGHAIYITGPFDRVANASRANKVKYLPFTPDSVQAWMTAPVLLVRIDPTAPRNTAGEAAPPVEHVVLVPKNGDRTPLQPSVVEKNSIQWQNGFGATFAAGGLYAAFDLTKIPQDDFEVVVIGGPKEARYKIGRDDIARSLRSAP